MTLTMAISQKENLYPSVMLILLSFLLIAYPFLWLLGLDGFAWMFLLPAAAMLSLMQNTALTPRLFVFALGSAIFVVGAFVGALHIEADLRYLTWFRDTYLIATLMIVAWSLANCPKDRLQSGIIYPIAAILFFSSVLGVLAIISSSTLEFESVAARAMPRIAAETDFGRRLVHKQIATEGYFAGIPYLRVSGTFDYATSYGAVLAVFCVFAISDWSSRVRARFRWLFAGLLALLMVNLAFTTARASILALSGGILVVVFLVGGKGLRVALSVFVITAISMSLPVFDDLLTLRGEGTLVTRLEIYSRTAEAILDNPLGHGSQTDSEGLRFPLGSHSTWLALPYKYGLIGCVGLALVFISLVWKRVFYEQHKNTQAAALVVVLFTIAIFEELYLDAMAGIIMASLLGSALSKHRSLGTRTESNPQTSSSDIDVA